MRVLLFLSFLLTAFPAQAQELPLCDDALLQWREVCLGVGLSDEGCGLEDYCLVLDEEPAMEEVIKGAQVETPSDTPEGYTEQIYIVP